MNIERHGVGPRMSQAVVHGNTVYIGGQVADGTSLDARDQTRRILSKIDALLQSAGSNRRGVLFANVWLADVSDYDAMNAEWDAWIAPGQAPARATVEAVLVYPQFRVEIAVIAAIGSAGEGDPSAAHPVA